MEGGQSPLGHGLQIQGLRRLQGLQELLGLQGLQKLQGCQILMLYYSVICAKIRYDRKSEIAMETTLNSQKIIKMFPTN